MVLGGESMSEEFNHPPENGEKDENNTVQAQSKNLVKVTFLTAGVICLLVIGYGLGKNSGAINYEGTATTEVLENPYTTETTQSYPNAENELPTNSNDPYDTYFHITPCSLSRSYTHSDLEIKSRQSEADIAELRRRAEELADNDYHRQKELFDAAFSQYAAQKSIEAIESIPSQDAKPGSLKDLWQRSGYPAEQGILQSIIAKSQQKCPGDYVSQLDEIQMQVEAYSKINQ
jgi:hypothetical protein